MTTISDNFNRADNTNISTGAPFPWSEIGGDWQIISNQLGIGVNINMVLFARADSDLASADHSSQATWTGGTTSATFGGAAVRFSSSATTCYFSQIAGDKSNRAIFKSVAGTNTSLGTFSSPAGSVAAVHKLTVSGSTLEIFIGGVSLGTITDTAITTGTRTALFTFSGSSNTAHWDDFSAADLGAAFVAESQRSRMRVGVVRASHY